MIGIVRGWVKNIDKLSKYEIITFEKLHIQFWCSPEEFLLLLEI